jgi:hypothetical protein
LLLLSLIIIKTSCAHSYKSMPSMLNSYSWIGKLISNARAVVPSLWYVYPWEYAADRLGVHENNIGNGGKRQKKGVKIKHKNKVMKFWFTKRDLCERCH